MSTKPYSLQVKKTIMVILHLMFLILSTTGITSMYLHGQMGVGLTWLLANDYEDSPQFYDQFNSDLESIFKYIAYRDVFETNGNLDLSKEMFSITKTDSEIIYTLEEVIRYAQGQGFYLTNDFQVVNDLFIYDQPTTANDYYVNWRSYRIDSDISEPGAAYSSLLDLSKEVLECLSDYYSVYYRMIAHPSNIYFHIQYEHTAEKSISYSNVTDLNLHDLLELGTFCYLTNNSVLIETSLREIPVDLISLMDEHNFYEAPNYSLVVAVDTTFPAEDLYLEEKTNYELLQSRFLEGLLCFVLGSLGCIVSLYYLLVVSGYKTSDRINPYLHSFDTITTESCIMLTILSTLFALFLGNEIGYRLIYLLLPEHAWSISERMLRAVIIYLCSLCGVFSLLRRYKSRQLYTNSTFYHFKENLNAYFAHRSFSKRLLYFYSIFLGIQFLGITFIYFAFAYRETNGILGILVLLVLGLIAIDYYVFHYLFQTEIQKDRINDAIYHISAGNTDYIMNLDGLTGKELELGRMLNHIGIEFERALQEQIKSERLKADLITNVSHDIKTPLTSIINYVDLIKREKIDHPRLKEYLIVLEQKSQRLKILTEDLVEASKASSGNLKLEMAPIDLVEMIWQTNGEFEEKYTIRHLELVSQLPNESLVIEADGRRLWRVLENLYNNAFKYAMEHSRVYIDVIRDENIAVFVIKNVSETPLNITPSDLTERFVRGDVSRTTEGSGLGLSIAKSLTNLQGGDFEIIIDGDLFKVQLKFPLLAKDL